MEKECLEDKYRCASVCESDFTSCTSQRPIGCGEALRLCRERCKEQIIQKDDRCRLAIATRRTKPFRLRW